MRYTIRELSRKFTSDVRLFLVIAFLRRFQRGICHTRQITNDVFSACETAVLTRFGNSRLTNRARSLAAKEEEEEREEKRASASV